MKRVNRFNHAYSQAPWRLERQWISIFLLIVLGFAMIATLYLMVSSQAAIFGREIQDLRQEIIETEHMNSDLQTELARLTSKDEVERRAYGLRYRPIEAEELDYLYVPGYIMPDEVTLAAALDLQPSPPRIPPEYTQSLLEWIDESIQMASRGQK